jgi:signal transduction histidine kinase
VADPSALLATLAGGAVALAAITALRPRRERAAARRVERRTATYMGEDFGRRVPLGDDTEETPAGDTTVTTHRAGATGRPVEESIVREIAHSLNTPLAQIEATILAFEPQSEEQKKKISSLLDAARICKSFLAAFREVATISGDAEAWQPESLSSSLKAAANVYGSRIEKEFRLRVNVPDRIPGYDNNYILAITLPVLENAIEAVEPNGSVEVKSLLEPDASIISVSNETSIAFLPEDIYEPEYTTKPGHSGFGLAVVRRLVAGRPDAGVRHDVRDGRVVCTVNLPRRQQR